VLVLAGLLLGVRFLPAEKDESVAWQDLTSQVGPLTIVHSEQRVFRDRASFAKYLAPRPAPAVDVSTRQLLLVSPGPRSSTGYSVDVVSARLHGDEIVVRVRERTPGLEQKVQPRVTYPYRLISLPAGKDVSVDWVGR
jgi:protease stability complex PrcB-like protein